MTCAALATIAAWALGELPEAEADRFEEHYFGCDVCARNAERMERLLAQLIAALPPVLTSARRQALAARHPHMRAIDVEPGQRAQLHLGASAPIGIWIMHAPLGAATRVNLQARGADDALLFTLSDVPFDVERGEVVLACQAHYRALGPSEMHIRLTATGGDDDERPVGEYILDHVFENL